MPQLAPAMHVCPRRCYHAPGIRRLRKPTNDADRNTNWLFLSRLDCNRNQTRKPSLAFCIPTSSSIKLPDALSIATSALVLLVTSLLLLSRQRLMVPYEATAVAPWTDSSFVHGFNICQYRLASSMMPHQVFSNQERRSGSPVSIRHRGEVLTPPLPKQGMSLTIPGCNLSQTDAAKYMKKHGYRVDVAVDAYFESGAQSSSIGVPTTSSQDINVLFDQYKGQ